MKTKFAAVAFITCLYAPLVFGTTVDLRGALFKAGHPVKGESLKASVADSETLVGLKRTLETLKRFPELQFEVSGHCDHYECSGAECNELALRRALLVYRFLLDGGIDPRRLTSLTEYGSSRHIAGTRSEYKVNQRAEINITQNP